MEIVEATDRDIWDNKKSDDFLRYLKWEAFQYGYFITAAIMNIFLYSTIGSESNEADKAIKAFCLQALLFFFIKRAIQLKVLQYQLRQGSRFRYFKCSCNTR